MSFPSPRIAVVYPDYLGQATSAGFDRTLVAALPGAFPVAVVNAPADADLPTLNPHPDTVVVRTPAGFNTAVLAGLHTALELGADRIVRLDTAEHDPDHASDLVARLDDVDVVVADLCFDEDTLVADSADSYHNKFVMPLLLQYLTGDQVALSGAHGYMALRRHALDAVLPYVTGAWESTGATVAERVMWSADTLLVTAAARLGLTVDVRLVPAHELRNRPETKAATQLRDTVLMHQALDRILPVSAP